MLLSKIIELLLLWGSVILFLITIIFFIVLFNDKKERLKPIKDMTIGTFILLLMWIASIYILTKFLYK